MKVSFTISKAALVAAVSALMVLLVVVSFGASDLNRNGEKMKVVSLVELIANPEKFDGQRVIVQGFVRLEFEGTGLYFHEEDYRHGLRYNAVGLSTTYKERDQAKDFDLQYCTIIGTYHAVSAGYVGLWSGSLSNVKFVGGTSGPATERDVPKPAYLSYTPFEWENSVAHTPQQVRDLLHESIKNGLDKSQATATYEGVVRLTLSGDIQQYKSLLKQRDSKLKAADFGDTRLLFEADAGETQIFVDREGTVMQGNKYWRLSTAEFTQLKQMLGIFYHKMP